MEAVVGGKRIARRVGVIGTVVVVVVVATGTNTTGIVGGRSTTVRPVVERGKTGAGARAKTSPLGSVERPQKEVIGAEREVAGDTKEMTMRGFARAAGPEVAAGIITGAETSETAVATPAVT